MDTRTSTTTTTRRVALCLSGALLAAAGLAPEGASQVPGALEGRAPEAAAPAAALSPLPSDGQVQDAADSLYRVARRALNQGEYARAARLFESVVERHPESRAAPDALYWKAMAIYHGSDGDTEALRRAVRALEEQERRYPDARTRSDARALALRMRGMLARMGDEEAAAAVAEASGLLAYEASEARQVREVARESAETARESREVAREAAEAARARRAYGARGSAADQGECGETDLQVTALHALAQMGTDRVIPILEKVLARRDPCSTQLRRRAMMLLAQHGGAVSTDMLIEAYRQDPDPDVRRQAVFWLSQVEDERAVDALMEIVQNTDDPEVRKQAVFALSQHESAKAGRLMRSLAEDPSASREVRAHAIVWMGEREDEGSGEYLRSLFDELDDPELQEKVLYAVARTGESSDAAWLLDVAVREELAFDARKKALFWAAQAGGVEDRLLAMYDDVEDRGTKEQLIWIYSQMDAPEATDTLIELARTEDDPELRKKVVFWLSQTDDPRALEILEEIVGG